MKNVQHLTDYYSRYLTYYSPEVLEYSRIVVAKINETESLQRFFEDNNIIMECFLNEMLPLSEFKYQTAHNEMLDMNEINYVFNLVLISNELAFLVHKKHARAIAIRQSGRLTYEMDEVAISKLKSKFGMNLESKFFSLDDLAIDDDEIIE